jgi:hypothetical protein
VPVVDAGVEHRHLDAGPVEARAPCRGSLDLAEIAVKRRSVDLAVEPDLRRAAAADGPAGRSIAATSWPKSAASSLSSSTAVARMLGSVASALSGEARSMVRTPAARRTISGSSSVCRSS